MKNEAETVAMQRFVSQDDVELVGSLLLETELRRMAVRNDADQSTVTAVLEGITLYPFEQNDFTQAGLLPGKALRSLDALHIQCALNVGIDCVVTYDMRMIDACNQVGLATIQPTMDDDVSGTPPTRRRD